MNNVVLDFETRSFCDLKTHGGWVYSGHETTEILCMAYKINAERIQLWVPGDDMSDLLRVIQSGNFLLHAHNSSFEYVIWKNCATSKYGFPEVPLENFRCIAAKAAAASLPRSLDKATSALNLSHRKDSAGHALMLQMCKPRKPTKNNPSVWFDDKDRFARLCEYCVKDVEAEYELNKQIDNLISFEQEVFLMDQKINFRGALIDVASVKKIISLVNENYAEFESHVPRLTKGVVESTLQVQKLTNYLRANGVNIENISKNNVQMTLLTNKDLPDNIKELLELRLMMSRSSVKKYEKLLEIASFDNRGRGMLLYHGSHTGRWSGMHFQPQNLPRGKIKDVDLAIDLINTCGLQELRVFYGTDILDFFSGCIRGMIIAQPGKDLMVADYAAIEARVLAWLSGEQVLLGIFRTGGDVYKDMAAAIYNKNTEDVTDKERFVGKWAILGLGYGMSHTKFYAQCLSSGVEIDLELTQRIVKIYRNRYKNIVNSWYGIEDNAKACISTGAPFNFKGIYFSIEKGNLKVGLPSGRKLVYNDPKLVSENTPYGEKSQISFMGVDSITGNWVEQRTYGGKLTENIVQAIARDLLANALINCEKEGYPIVLHVHDEIIAEVDENFGSLREFEEIICRLPEWARGIPVSAESWRGKRYKK